jgi:hypothetical protein
MSNKNFTPIKVNSCNNSKLVWDELHKRVKIPIGVVQLTGAVRF